MRDQSVVWGPDWTFKDLKTITGPYKAAELTAVSAEEPELKHCNTHNLTHAIFVQRLHLVTLLSSVRPLFLRACPSLLAISSQCSLVPQKTLVPCPVRVGSAHETKWSSSLLIRQVLHAFTSHVEPNMVNSFDKGHLTSSLRFYHCFSSLLHIIGELFYPLDRQLRMLILLLIPVLQTGFVLDLNKPFF